MERFFNRKLIIPAVAVAGLALICRESSNNPGNSGKDQASVGSQQEPESKGAYSQKALKEILEKKGSSVLRGYVSISKEVNIRTQPRVEVYEDRPNTIKWEDIDSLNGVPIAGVKSFIVIDPLIVSGKDPSGLSKEAPWLVFMASVKGQWLLNGEKIVYISLSDQTADHIRRFSTGNSSSYPNPLYIGAIIPQK